MMGWEWRLRTVAITGLLFILRVNVSGEQWWWWFRLGITSDFSTRARWQSYQQRNLEPVEGMNEGLKILPIQYLWSVKGSLTCRKILRHGSSGFTSHPKEVVLRIFIALKNTSPWLSFKVFVSSGKHTNHYTTEAISYLLGEYLDITGTDPLLQRFAYLIDMI
jgi:hypothetical protein